MFSVNIAMCYIIGNDCVQNANRSAGPELNCSKIGIMIMVKAAVIAFYVTVFRAHQA